jgi:hypothetical protein
MLRRSSILRRPYGNRLRRGEDIGMKRQNIFLWTGGQPEIAKGCWPLVQKLPVFPAPAPLRRAARIVYQWGPSQFEVLATACSVRTTPWGAEEMTWLQCKAKPTSEIKPDNDTSLVMALIPARYVTHFEPGPGFRLTKCRQGEDLAVFPPNQAVPPDALPLTEIERVLDQLLVPERN